MSTNRWALALVLRLKSPLALTGTMTMLAVGPDLS